MSFYVDVKMSKGRYELEILFSRFHLKIIEVLRFDTQNSDVATIMNMSKYFVSYTLISVLKIGCYGGHRFERMLTK
jgi:hypothetical protein